jgi:hypothetical protein
LLPLGGLRVRLSRQATLWLLVVVAVDMTLAEAAVRVVIKQAQHL